MRPDTKLKVARRKHTVELLRWLYSRRDANLDGAHLSFDHRNRQQGGIASSRPLTYGEVDVADFLSILDIVKPRDGEVFVDLGSGAGKAVLASSCGFPEFSKCRGIELVQGLADAAADHLRTAMAFLGKPPPPSGKVESGNATFDSTLTADGPGAVVGAPPVPNSGKHTNEKPRPGKGGGRRGGKKPSGGKAASQGLSALALESLIADLLSQCSLTPRQPRTVADAEEEARAPPRATTEEIASWLVRELGHRRYKGSLRGYGGLQKFLVARRRAGDGALSLLTIAEDGSEVTLAPAPTEDPSPILAPHSLSRGRREADVRTEAGEAGSCPCGATGGRGRDVRGCPPGTEKGTTALDVAAAAHGAGVTPDLQEELGDRAPLGDPRLPASPVGTVSTAASTSASSSPCSGRDGPTPADEIEPIPALPMVFGVGPIGNSDGSGGIEKAGGGVDTGRRRLPQDGPLTCQSFSGVELVCGDIFQETWDDAGVVYVASLLFDDDMMARLSKCLERLRKGARVISLRPIPALEPSGKEVPPQSEVVLVDGDVVDSNGDHGGEAAGRHPVLQLLHEGLFKMSWQMARVYIYVRS